MAMAQTQHEIFKRKAADIFTFLDHDKDGNLKIEDLRKGFKKLGIPLTSHDVILEEIQSHHSPQNRNIVTKEEFEEYSEKQFEKVKDLFNKLDKQGDHLLTIDELMEGLREFEPHFKHDELEIKKLFKRVDHDNDGAIGFEEWCKFLILLPQANIKTVMKHWEVAVTISEQNEIPLLEFEEEKPDFIDLKMSSEVQKWINSFGAGLFAGIISRTTTAPLDRLKFIYQIHYKDHKRPPSIREGLRGIYRADGISGLFRGNLVNILKASPETSIRLTVFEKLKATLVSDETELSLKNLFIAGAASGVIANLAVFPMDVLRTRLAAAPSGTYFGVTDAITTIIRTEGIRSFYRGLQASLSASLPNAGLNLMSYEALKDIMVGKRPKAEPSPFTFMIVGGLSAMFSSTILYPFQVVTSRLIMQNLLEKGQKQGMFELGKRIWTKEGSFGFYKGYCPAISKIVIGNAISFSCFEFLKKSLSIDFRKH